VIKQHWFIGGVFLLALVLMLVPMPGWTAWLRPDFVLLAMIFFLVMAPEKVSVGYVFILGLLLDLCSGSLLGEHALALLPIAYVLGKSYKQVRMFPRTQQMLGVFMCALFYKVIIFIVQGLQGQTPVSFLYWLTTILDAILWPWLFIAISYTENYFDSSV
jgi:rod shape-determining protein MreD